MACVGVPLHLFEPQPIIQQLHMRRTSDGLYTHRILRSDGYIILLLCFSLLRNKTLNQTRPVNLNLFTIKFPIAAIVSILHRLSGVALFLFIPFGLWMLYHSLHSETDFVFLGLTLKRPLFKFLVWLWLTSLGYHLIAGIRHILADLHIGLTKEGSTRSAGLVIIVALILSIIIGFWLC